MDPVAVAGAVTGAIPESARLAKNLMAVPDSYAAKRAGTVPSQKEPENQRKLVEKSQQIRIEFGVSTPDSSCMKHTSCTLLRAH
jgi:hypothetical protein